MTLSSVAYGVAVFSFHDELLLFFAHNQKWLPGFANQSWCRSSSNTLALPLYDTFVEIALLFALLADEPMFLDEKKIILH